MPGLPKHLGVHHLHQYVTLNQAWITTDSQLQPEKPLPPPSKTEKPLFGCYGWSSFLCFRALHKKAALKAVRICLVFRETQGFVSTWGPRPRHAPPASSGHRSTCTNQQEVLHNTAVSLHPLHFVSAAAQKSLLVHLTPPFVATNETQMFAEEGRTPTHPALLGRCVHITCTHFDRKSNIPSLAGG